MVDRAIYEDLGRARPGVVVGGQAHAVSSRVKDSEDVSWLDGRKIATQSDEISGLADGAYDVDRSG